MRKMIGRDAEDSGEDSPDDFSYAFSDVFLYAFPGPPKYAFTV